MTTLERFKDLVAKGDAGREGAVAIARNYLAKHADELSEMTGEDAQTVAEMQRLIEGE